MVQAAYSSGLSPEKTEGPVMIVSTEHGITVTVTGTSWIVNGQIVAAAPGPVADEGTVASVRALLRERVACQNAGDAPRYLALHSDAWIADSFMAAAKPGPDGKPHVPEESWEYLFTSPLYDVYEPDWRPEPEIAGVWSLPDGRVAAIAVPRQTWREEQDGKSVPPELLICAIVDGRWFVDYSHAIDSTSSSLATPQSMTDRSAYHLPSGMMAFNNRG
jgi:hypothetical protein